MNEKIVIVVEKTGKKWIGRIYGQVGDKVTEQKETVPHDNPDDCIEAVQDFYLDKILEWMEKIQ